MCVTSDTVVVDAPAARSILLEWLALMGISREEPSFVSTLPREVGRSYLFYLPNMNVYFVVRANGLIEDSVGVFTQTQTPALFARDGTILSSLKQ